MKKWKDKRNVLIIGIGIIGMVFIIIGITYAYIAYYANQKEMNKIGSNCLKINYIDASNAINLNDIYPMTEEAGQKTEPYRFRIKNECDIGVDYNVNLEVIDVENRIPSNNIAAKIDDNRKDILISDIQTKKIETTEYTAIEAYKLYSGKLNPKETKEHSLRLWLDESAGNESQNKVFHSKVVISAVQNEIVFHEDLTQLAEIIDINPKEVNDILQNPEDINKIISSKDAMELLTNSEYLKEELKNSEHYTDTIKKQILNSTVITEREKYNAGLPFYLFKNGNTGFTWNRNLNYMNTVYPNNSQVKEGTASTTTSLYIADDSASYYMGGELYIENLNLNDYKNIGFRYTLNGTCSGVQSQYRQQNAFVKINGREIWGTSYNCSNQNEENILSIEETNAVRIAVSMHSGGLMNYITNVSVPIMYLY